MISFYYRKWKPSLIKYISERHSTFRTEKLTEEIVLTSTKKFSDIFWPPPGNTLPYNHLIGKDELWEALLPDKITFMQPCLQIFTQARFHISFFFPTPSSRIIFTHFSGKPSSNSSYWNPIQILPSLTRTVLLFDSAFWEKYSKKFSTKGSFGSWNQITYSLPLNVGGSRKGSSTFQLLTVWLDRNLDGGNLECPVGEMKPD